LWLLGSLAGFYRRPFDAALVLQRFAPPFDIPSLIEALEALGLKAGLAAWPEEDLSGLPLPAVAFLSNPDQAPPSIDAGTAPESAAARAVSAFSPVLVVKHGDHTLAWVRRPPIFSSTWL
jgi:subfamily B ATP-binding cassette protein HlyB/CyaB